MSSFDNQLKSKSFRIDRVEGGRILTLVPPPTSHQFILSVCPHLTTKTQLTTPQSTSSGSDNWRSLLTLQRPHWRWASSGCSSSARRACSGQSTRGVPLAWCTWGASSASSRRRDSLAPGAGAGTRSVHKCKSTDCLWGTERKCTLVNHLLCQRIRFPLTHYINDT